MSTFKQRLLFTCLVFTVSFTAQAQAPGLGTAVSEATIAESFVLPDGRGLPEGRGDVASGEILFNQHCRSCHGVAGQGGINDALAGGQGSLTTAAPMKTIGSYWPYATTLFDYIRRAMPYATPGILAPDQVYSITAYLLHVNGIIAEDVSVDSSSLPKIRMPNRDGFESAL